MVESYRIIPDGVAFSAGCRDGRRRTADECRKCQVIAGGYHRNSAVASACDSIVLLEANQGQKAENPDSDILVYDDINHDGLYHGKTGGGELAVISHSSDVSSGIGGISAVGGITGGMAQNRHIADDTHHHGLLRDGL